MRSTTQPIFRQPQSASAATPRANSVFDNFNTSIENSTHAVYALVERVNTLADQARGSMPASDNGQVDSAPSTESLLQGLERAIASLQETVGRLDNH